MIKARLRYLFLPYLIMLVSVLTIYTLLHWLIFIKFELIPVFPEYLKFGIPILITILIIWLWYGPKLVVFQLSEKKLELIRFLSGVLFLIPFLISQALMISLSGNKIDLKTINEISQDNKVKYYTIQNYSININMLSAYVDYNYSGRYNEKLNIKVYFVIPFLEPSNEINFKECKAWLGVEKHKQISAASSNDFINEETERFILKCIDELKDSKFPSKYFDTPEDSGDKKGFQKAIDKNSFFNKKSKIVLLPIDTPFKERNIITLRWFWGSLIVGPLIWLTILLFPKLNKGGIRKLKSGNLNKQYLTNLKYELGFLIPNKLAYHLYLIFYLNIIVFIILLIAGYGFIDVNGQDLLNAGALYRPYVIEGEYWRIITSMFLHSGFIHILNNLAILFMVSIIQLNNLKPRQFLIVYFLSGVGSGISSLYWHEATISVGASGAILGLEGVLLVFLFTNVYSIEFTNSNILLTLGIVGLTLLSGLFTNADNAGHLGGLLTGIFLGIILRFQFKTYKNRAKPKQKKKQSVKMN